MSRSDLDRLRDARQAARSALGDAGGLSADVLAEATQPQHAALFDLIVVGEALNWVSDPVKSAAPQVEWRSVVDLRNIIVHAYWQIDLEIIAYIIEHELEPLITELDKLIALLERGEP